MCIGARPEPKGTQSNEDTSAYRFFHGLVRKPAARENSMGSKIAPFVVYSKGNAREDFRI